MRVIIVSDIASKKDLRIAALAARDALPVAERRRAAQAIAMRRFPVPLGEGTIVAGYSPIRSECDPVPLMRSLAANGAALALPIVHANEKSLTFAEWRQGERLIVGPYGILQPRVEAISLEPDIILVPLAAFDRRCRRIGYGVGYYDRTLSILRKQRPVIAVGIAFAAQEVETVPTGEHDEHLDLVLTEREIIDFRSN
ncbi:5-formyltetrahydrofolate cyclo-ligase [Bradyrhizobium sp. LHD-71]|uniref:5-formyltetrahydrofolate cyclo-ligase n=1 Tax=Bradyrhizobium sp. LHD-71 TaxID=3072141 RepID=UPI00280F8950|nr:5-formyltetrahydrofolate cyclo-ligase [Bradyrhizobium sp. LHD-71]MDQ8726739.1 5-formyltetrahydrofolate cyclo-ligase [Bradyrhizobium sp. LHD-71]